jgi:DNA-binding CsgD family transcriptional regulator
VKEVDLPYDYHDLTIYAASSLLDPNNQISYRVEGLPGDWSAWQSGGSITPQLPDGRSVLLVRKHRLKGMLPELTLRIHVHPPWYKTYWAYIAYLLITAGISVLLGHYFISRERDKNERLSRQLLENELAGKRNELGKQTADLVRKSRALAAIIEELENQKNELGERYPLKLYNRLRSLIEKEFTDDSDWMAFDAYFNSAHQAFIERFRAKYKEITSGDMRLCCLLRMNLSTKEVASILHISIRAVELRRYRLRKRIGLDANTNLVAFLMKF